MTVSTIDGNSTGLTRTLQSFAPPRSAPRTGTSAGVDADGDHDGTQVGGAEKGGRHGHHQGGLLGKIQSALTNALQSAPADADPNKVIQDALTNLFQQNDNTSKTPANQTTNADGSAVGATPTSPHGALAQVLQQYGVQPQQFVQDLRTALQNAGPNAPDLSHAFRGFPPGSSVDSVA